jgi:hypothetical protein
VFEVAEDRCTEQVLRPEDSCELLVAFRPAAEGQPGDVLVVASDDAPRTVSLSGTGVAETSLVAVPDLVGLSLDEAEQATSAAGLALVPQRPGEAADTTVDGQDPAPGTLVTTGTPVAVTLSGVEGTQDLGWLPWAGAGLLGVLALARAAGRRRSSRWVRKHVRVRPRSQVPVEIITEELEGTASHAVRIAVRAHAGVQSVHEVTR